MHMLKRNSGILKGWSCRQKTRRKCWKATRLRWCCNFLIDDALGWNSDHLIFINKLAMRSIILTGRILRGGFDVIIIHSPEDLTFFSINFYLKRLSRRKTFHDLPSMCWLVILTDQALRFAFKRRNWLQWFTTISTLGILRTWNAWTWLNCIINGEGESVSLRTWNRMSIGCISHAGARRRAFEALSFIASSTHHVSGRRAEVESIVLFLTPDLTPVYLFWLRVLNSITRLVEDGRHLFVNILMLSTMLCSNMNASAASSDVFHVLNTFWPG